MYEALRIINLVLGVKRSSVLLFDEDGIMRFKASVGLSDKYKSNVEGHSPWKRDTKHPKPILVSNVAKEPSLKALKKIILKEGIQALAFIPLVYKNQLLGKFMIYYDIPHEFSTRELRLTKGLARFIAFAAKEKQIEQDEKNEIRRREEVEKELRKSRDQLDIILKNIADGVTVQDRTGRLVFANKVAAFASGYNSPEDMLKNPRAWMGRFELRDETGVQFSFERLPGRRALRGELDPEEIINFREKQNSSENRWSVIKARPVFDEYGNVRMVINIIHDITVIKELESRKEEFIGIASHELKTPITSIKAFVQLLQKKFSSISDNERAKYLSQIDTQLNNLTDLISDLLDTTRISAGKLELRKTKFDLNTLVDEKIQGLQSMTDKHILIRGGRVKGQVFADRERIGQVITNFVSNAIKYTPRGSPITIRLSNGDGDFTLEVKDRGMGITEEDQKKIFERFFRTSFGKDRSFAGLGVGLYISREIIRRHQGKIWVRSQLGKGSSFYFSLPKERRL